MKTVKVLKTAKYFFTGRVQPRQWLRFRRRHPLEVEQLRNKLEQGMVPRNMSHRHHLLWRNLPYSLLAQSFSPLKRR